MSRIREPLFTREVLRSQFSLPDGATFVYGVSSDEDRAIPSPAWLARLEKAHATFLTIAAQNRDSFLAGRAGEVSTEVFLHEADEVRSFVEHLATPIYLDITGLTYRTWAPVVRAAIETSTELFVVYMEPAEYKRVEAPSAGTISNLSDKYEGIEPIPGFARIAAVGQAPATFVPMIGFEGARLEHIFDRTDTIAETTFPIIGVPGFRPEYSFYAYKGNQHQLENDFLASRVQYAKANCPFEAFQILQEIDSWSDFGQLKIAPIGTKPHGLGAVLFAIARGHRVELVYDHPVRSRNRTTGEARMCIYDLPAFVQTDLFKGV